MKLKLKLHQNVIEENSESGSFAYTSFLKTLFMIVILQCGTMESKRFEFRYFHGGYVYKMREKE